METHELSSEMYMSWRQKLFINAENAKSVKVGIVAYEFFYATICDTSFFFSFF